MIEKTPEKRLVRDLIALLGKDYVIDNPERRRLFETDGLTAKKQIPRVVALPGTIEEVQAISAYCHTNEIPLVVRGAGTGLSGGALPHPDGVLMVMSRFSRILSIDPVQRLARIEPGVTNLAISESVKHLGLYYAPDPSSQIACTIGGNVAENSGGVHCLKYGLTVHNIRALKIVSPEGEVYSLGSEALESPGLDLLSLMHGSEGLLGTVVEITVRLLIKPESVSVLLAGFDELAVAGEAVGRILSRGLIPAGLEMMDHLAIKAAEAFVGAGYPQDVAALLICEMDGTREEVEQQMKTLETLLTQSGARHIRIAWSEEERARLWQGRKSAFPAVGRLSPDYYCMDGTIPRRRLGEVLKAISSLSETYGLAVANVFHAGDGNLHPLILYDANKPGELEQAEALGSHILEICLKAGGTITGEHGVGVEKIDQMCLQFGPDELGVFHGIKRAFDQKGILNPGKAIPSLHRCAEFGAMHVTSGRESFPELERF